MPPLGLLPGRPTGAPDIVSTGYGSGMGPGPASASGASDVQRWEQYLADIREAMKEAAGFERIKLERQYEDAAKARDNAMAMARLQAETSRYGTDVGRSNLLAQLEQNDRQFAANHDLEMKRFGLDYAKSYSDYVLTPDRYAAGADFVNMASRVASGQGGPSPYGAGNTFKPKGESDFAVLASGPGANPGSSTGNAQQYASTAASGGGAGSDARVAAIKKMFDVVPPSEGQGLNDNDFAVLAAAKSLMSTNLQPGSIERMRPDQRAIYSSYVKRSGRSWDDYLTDYQRGGVGQGAARRA